MDNNAIVTRGLCKSYGDVQALRGVDLQIGRGEIFGFLGPNGAGKTTTIRCLLDLIRPSAGYIRVLGIDPQADPVAVRACVGYLPGELHLDGNMTAEAALRFFNSLRGGKADERFIRHLADRLALNLNTPIKNFSKGNKQKVGVIQALMHRPELLLLDEPTSGLDPLLQKEVLRLIVEARIAGATVFFSSHILSEVQGTAGRVAIIREGKVVETAETEELIRRAWRRVRIRFREPTDALELETLPGIKLIEKEDSMLVLHATGEMDSLIKALARHQVLELDSERATLEDVFLSYYEAAKE